jgi:type IV pilus assembly protein PilZ
LNHREFFRIPLALQVEYRTPGSFLVAYTVNLSKGGMFIETPTPAEMGTELVLSFAVPGNDAPFQVKGHVVWVRKSPSQGEPAGMGVEFEAFDARYGEFIDRIVAGFSGLRVLTMAVNAGARTLLTRTVRSVLGNAEVIETIDAETAEAAFARDPDIAIIVVDEGEEEGFPTIRLAKTTVGRQLPVIVISRDEALRARALELGADEVLPSLSMAPEIQAAVVRAVGRPLRVDETK